MTASFCPQTKGADPHQSVLIRAARRQTIPLHNSKNSCSLALLRALRGVSPTPGVPQKGTFLWVTGNPACTPPADLKYLRTCQLTEQPTEGFNCVQREAWWHLPLEFPSRCIFLVMVELMKFPGSLSMLLHKVFETLRFASCVTLSQHSWNGPLCWS